MLIDSILFKLIFKKEIKRLFNVYLDKVIIKWFILQKYSYPVILKN